jgi:fido (protein-threonine AMPylation protein)
VPPPGCPEWDYETHPDCGRLLPLASADVLRDIASGAHPVAKSVRDSRAIHRKLFAQLWPPGHAYYVGNFRGLERKKCLKDYDVRIPSDPLVGVPAAKVIEEITKLADEIAVMTEAVDAELRDAGANISAANRSISVVRLACDAFVRFLTVHPFANGNGHVARAILFILLRHFGFNPDRWTIEPRPRFPGGPDYSDMIYKHRRGDVAPLEQFVLSCLSSIR